MSDKEKALDALQEIINLTSCHTMSKVNDEIIAQSEIIKKALSRVPDIPVDEGIYVSCYYASISGRTVPISEAKVWYTTLDSVCQQCERCL